MAWIINDYTLNEEESFSKNLKGIPNSFWFTGGERYSVKV